MTCQNCWKFEVSIDNVRFPVDYVTRRSYTCKAHFCRDMEGTECTEPKAISLPSLLFLGRFFLASLSSSSSFVCLFVRSFLFFFVFDVFVLVVVLADNDMVQLKDSYESRIEKMRREAEAKLTEVEAETDMALSSIQSLFDSQVAVASIESSPQSIELTAILDTAEYVFDVTSIGQRSLPWTCNSVKNHEKIHLECKLHFSQCTTYVAYKHSTNASECI